MLVSITSRVPKVDVAAKVVGVPTAPFPNTSAKLSRCKWKPYRDTNWWCICSHTNFSTAEGILLQSCRDRDGRCIAILSIRSIGVRVDLTLLTAPSPSTSEQGKNTHKVFLYETNDNGNGPQLARSATDPWQVATCKAVLPSESLACAAVKPLLSSSKNLTMAQCPQRAATCSAVSSMSPPVTFPLSNTRLTASQSPAATASSSLSGTDEMRAQSRGIFSKRPAAILKRRHDCLYLHGSHPRKTTVLNHGLRLSEPWS